MLTERERTRVPVEIPTVKRGLLTRIKRYFTGADLDEAELAGQRTMARLPMPLPNAVRAVALAQLVTNGLASVVAVLGLAGAAVFIVVAPFLKGREGVGLAMITLFGAGVGALMSLPVLAGARGAARLLRGDSRGVVSLSRVVLFSLFVAVMGGCVGFLALNGVLGPEGAARGVFAAARTVLSVASGIGFQLWSVIVLRRYRRDVSKEPEHVDLND